MVLNLGYLFYLIAARPSVDKRLNRIEVINEFCIMIIGYFLLGFSDFVLEPKMKITIGSWMIWLTLLNLGFNFLMIVLKMIIIIKKWFL